MVNKKPSVVIVEEEPKRALSLSIPDKTDHALGSNLAFLMKTLQLVDATSHLATLNETTISDNNGGRIQL